MEITQELQLLNKYRSTQELNFGVEFKRSSDVIYAEFEVKESMLQPFGLLHGGVTCSIGEGVASIISNVKVAPDFVAVGQSLNVNHVRSAKLGDRVNVSLNPTHLGKRSHVWSVDFYVDRKLISSLTMTTAILPKK